MKNLFLFLIILFYSFAFSQSESDILFIKNKIENVNLQSKNYKITILKLEQSSTSKDNEIAVFTDNSGSIKMIRETYINETEKTVIWNYIDNKLAYFIFKEYYTYKLPTTNVKFNESKFTKTEEGFYLKNDRIIRWMKGNKLVTKYPINAASIENNMIQYIADIVTKFEQQISK